MDTTKQLEEYNDGFPERIRSVLHDRDMSIQALQHALENAGADNSGYTSVRRYVKGEFPPSVAWVEAAAKILDVPPAVLAFGWSPENEVVLTRQEVFRLKRGDWVQLGVADDGSLVFWALEQVS